MKKTEDRRTRKTESSLKDALTKLLIDKDLNSITISELADTADVHRATFYAHYQDIYELYDQLKSDVLDAIDHIIENDPSHSYSKVYSAIIDYVYTNKNMCKILFIRRDSNFRDTVSDLLEQKYLKIWLFEEHRTEITSEMRYLTRYHIQGCLSIIALWFESEFALSKERIINLIQKVDENFDLIS